VGGLTIIWDTVENPMRLQFGTFDGLTTRYADSGHPREPTILLTSPWPESVYAFAAIWTTLAEHARLFAVDLPGFGASESRDDLFSPRAMGGFLARLIAEADLGTPHIVAPDVGTSAALFAAAAHPARIKSVTVGTGGAAVPLQLGEPLRSWVLDPDLDKYRRTDPHAIVGAAVETIAGGVPDEIRADYLSCYEGDRFVESMRYVRRYPEELPALAELLPQITTPVTIINGRHDRVVPLAKRGVSRRAAAQQPPRDHRRRPLRLGGGACGVRLARPRRDHGRHHTRRDGQMTTVDEHHPDRSSGPDKPTLRSGGSRSSTRSSTPTVT
jgi:pimeloyl-ACP methyl ester carboxylesterase